MIKNYKISNLISGHFSNLFIIALAIFSLFYSQSDALTLLILTIATVSLIVFGKKFAFETFLEDRSIPGRESILPVIILYCAIAFGIVNWSSAQQVFIEKIDIIALILSFAVLSHGIGRSGYFRFAAYHIVGKCKGNTTRLILYLFILSSLLTFVTSNDIVVLILTPIIISICAHARIKNTKLLLLSQFVAANTLSMGLLIGSPTNIILSLGLEINFVEYLTLMIIPALVSFIVSFIVVDLINRAAESKNPVVNKSWEYVSSYTVPSFAQFVHFTPSMRNWSLLFIVSVALLTIVTYLEVSLFWSAIPSSLAGFWLLYGEDEYYRTCNVKPSTTNRLREIAVALRGLPYSVFFFGMCFFIFANEFIHTSIIQQTLIPLLNTHTTNIVTTPVMGIFASGIITNIFNDLPAAAMLSEILQSMTFINEWHKIMLLQAILVGVNIGCYLTPIGALAGLIWFNEMRKERRRLKKYAKGSGADAMLQTVILPSRSDLIRYGFTHFVVVAITVGILIPFFALIVDTLIRSPHQMGMIETALVSPLAVIVVGISVLILIIKYFSNILSSRAVILSHMRELFVVAGKFTIWTLRNKGAYTFLVAIIFVSFMGGALYWVESAHQNLYAYSGTTELEPLFTTFASYMTWLAVFIGSGFEQGHFPRSLLGMIITGLLPLITIGAVFYVVRATSKNNLKELAHKMATGEVPGYRIILVNYQSHLERFLQQVLYHPSAYIVLLCSEKEYNRTKSYIKELEQLGISKQRIYIGIKDKTPAHIFEEYNLETAEELYFFGDHTTEADYETLLYLTKMDTTLNAIRSFGENTSLSVPPADNISGAYQGAEAMLQYDEAIDKLPLIVVECPSKRFSGLINRSLSTLLNDRIIQVAYDGEVAKFLLGDLDSSITSLNAYYHTGFKNTDSSIFVGGISPTENYEFVSYKLDAKGEKKLQTIFSGANNKLSASNTLRENAIALSPIFNKKNMPSYITGTNKKQIAPSKLYGLVMDAGKARVHMGIPSAIMRMQAETANGVLMLQCASAKKVMPSKPKVFKTFAGRVLIVNLNTHACQFIDSLKTNFTSIKAPKIFIYCQESQKIPSRFREDKNIKICQKEKISKLLDSLVPPRGTKPITTEKQFILKASDRVYVFSNPQHKPNPELVNIDFIDGLAERLRLKKNSVHPNDFYLAVESRNRDTRFLFERLFVDKIFDSSHPRRAYFESLSLIFHRSKASPKLKHGVGDTIDDLRHAHKIALYLGHFVVDRVSDKRFKSSKGAKFLLLEQTFAEAIANVRTYSDPYIQLLTRFRLEVDKKSNKLQIKAVPNKLTDKLEEDDFILQIQQI